MKRRHVREKAHQCGTTCNRKLHARQDVSFEAPRSKYKENFFSFFSRWVNALERWKHGFHRKKKISTSFFFLRSEVKMPENYLKTLGPWKRVKRLWENGRGLLKDFHYQLKALLTRFNFNLNKKSCVQTSINYIGFCCRTVNTRKGGGWIRKAEYAEKSDTQHRYINYLTEIITAQ